MYTYLTVIKCLLSRKSLLNTEFIKDQEKVITSLSNEFSLVTNCCTNRKTSGQSLLGSSCLTMIPINWTIAFFTNFSGSLHSA